MLSTQEYDTAFNEKIGDTMPTRVRVLMPITVTEEERTEVGAALVAMASPELVLDLDDIPASEPSPSDFLAYRMNVAWAEYYGVPRALAAQNDGQDAVVVNCMRDPIVRSAREVCDIPIVGPTEASMHLAGLIGRTFGFVVFGDRAISPVEEQARLYGMTTQLAAVRAATVSLASAPTLPFETVIDEVVKPAIEVIEAGADSIILGCTGFRRYVPGIRKELARRGYEGIPFIEPLEAAIRQAAALAQLGLTSSRRAYPSSYDACAPICQPLMATRS